MKPAPLDSGVPVAEDPAATDVIIRFTRQIYYDDRSAFQAEVRAAPGLLRGGAFRADIEERVDELIGVFANRVREAQLYGFQSQVDDIDQFVERSAEDLAELGARLLALLPDSLRDALPGLLQRTFDKRRGLRITLEARAGDQADRLLRLPWEILYIERLKLHLGLIPGVLIVRRVLDAVRRTPDVLGRPYQVLHVVADSPERPLDPALVQVEQEALQRATATPGGYMLIERPGSVERMQAALLTQSYQVVHFLGHGLSDTLYTGQGYLLFEGPEGASQLVSGEQLQYLLAATPSVRLVVLHACSGAAANAHSVALQLVYSGVPIVVAMQDEIIQPAAKVFAETFYQELAKGVEVVVAVARARLALASRLPKAIDWSLPVVYTSAGVLPESRATRATSAIEHWLSLPAGKRQFGLFNLAVGSAHLLVAVLLLLSGSAARPLHLAPLGWVILILGLTPPLIAVAVYRTQLSIPPEWKCPALRALWLRLFGAAAISLALPMLFGWFLLILLAGLGFWALLSPLVQSILVVLALAPGLLVSWQFTIAHGRGFLTNGAITEPVLELSELVIVLAGYLIMVLPLGLSWLFPELLAPPLGNLVCGLLLIALGYSIRKDAAS